MTIQIHKMKLRLHKVFYLLSLGRSFAFRVDKNCFIYLFFATSKLAKEADKIFKRTNNKLNFMEFSVDNIITV